MGEENPLDGLRAAHPTRSTSELRHMLRQQKKAQ